MADRIVSPNAAISSGARDTAITFFTRLSVMAASLGIQSALAWLLGPSGRGSYAVCVLFAMLLGVVFALSVDRAGQYLIASGRAGVVEGVLVTLSAGLAGSAAGVIVGFILIHSGAEFFSKATPFAFKLSLILVPLNVLAESLIFLLIGVRRFAWMSRIAIIRVLTHLAATLVLVLGLGLGVNGALVALMMGNSAAIAVALGYFRREYGLGPRRLKLDDFRRLLSYGARYWVANLGSQMNFRIGTLVLAWFVTTTEIGLFAAAASLVARVLLIPDAIEAALLPRVAGDPGGRTELVSRVARLSLMVCGAVLVVLAAVSRPLVAVLFSHDFLPAVPLIWMIAVGMLLHSGSKVLVAYFMGINRPSVCSWAVVSAVAANFAALLLLLPVVGLPGAAWAMTIGYLARTSVLVLSFRATTGRGFRETWAPRRADFELLVELVRSRKWMKAGA
jgi:O-antigen/teichoic acid export membrane protein